MMLTSLLLYDYQICHLPTCTYLDPSMPSHLTRTVFRQILQNEPFTHTQCTRRSISSCLHRPRLVSSPRKNASVRSIWFLPAKSKQQRIRPQDYDPGIEELAENETRLRMNVRPLPRADVLRALREFLDAKFNPRPEHGDDTHVVDTQVKPLMAAVQMLQTRDEAGGPQLEFEDVEKALNIISLGKNRKLKEVAELARLLYDYVKDRRPGGDEFPHDQPGLVQYYKRKGFPEKILLPYVRLLGSIGQGVGVRDELQRLIRLDRALVAEPTYWCSVFCGLAEGGVEKEIIPTFKIMRTLGLPYHARCHAALVGAYAVRRDIEKVKLWYKFPINDPYYEDAKSGAMLIKNRNVERVLQLCISTKEFEWGQPILNEMLNGKMDKQKWNLVLQWAAAVGRGVDEVERMMNVMIREAQHSNALPDIDTINCLIEGANAKDDAYTAERFLEMGRRRDIQPNALTRILQMDYRLKFGDLDGARAAYKELKAHEVEENLDVPVINKMILALCRQEEGRDVNEIWDYVLDITERKASFTPEVIAAIAILHLTRHEFAEVIDLLNVYTTHLQSSERDLVRTALLDFVLDDHNHITLSWDAYMILREKFAELDNAARQRIMESFFIRGRVDMAVHTFGHMRQASLKERRPTAAHYAACFTGIARCRSLPSVQVVHNMLKLDSEVEPNTQLYNALMLSYMGADDPDQSLEHWDDITYSREGPTYESICIALLACQRSLQGEKMAKEIWARLKRLNVEISKETCLAYAAAMAAKGLTDEAFETVESMAAITGQTDSEVDVFT